SLRHTLGMSSCARIAKKFESGVTEDVLRWATNESVDDFQLDFSARYERAVEHSGNVRPRRRILHAMAESELREMKFQDVVKAVESKFPGGQAYTYLNIATGQLCKSERGGLLRKRPGGGGSFYSFSNPL